MELRLHPRITVLTGLAPLQRDALTAELESVLGAGRPGLNAELLEESGRILILQRPIGEPDKVIDALNGEDVTAEFRFGDTVSIAGSVGIDGGELRSYLRLGARNTEADVRHDDLIRRLGKIDQDRLWSAALALAEVEAEVASQSNEPDADDDFEHYVDAIEDCHLAVEQAHERVENSRAALTASSATLAILAFIAALLLHPIAAAPFVLLSIGCAGVSFWHFKKLEEATAAEVEVLNAAGLRSYLTLQLAQVERLTRTKGTDDPAISLNEIHRIARECWELAVGVVPLEWAVKNRSAIQAAARGKYPERTEASSPGDAVQRIRHHLDRIGTRPGGSLPAILDDPFAILDDYSMATVLSLITDHAHRGQVLIMTEDQRVIDWAEQLAGRSAATVLLLGDRRTPALRPSVHQHPAANMTSVG